MRLVLLALVVACKAKTAEQAAPAGSDSAPVVVHAPADASIDAPPAPVITIDKEAAIELDLAFDKHAPQLPALSADGKRWAEITTRADQPMAVYDRELEISDLATQKVLQTIVIVDEKIASDVRDPWDEQPPPKEIIAKLRAGAAAASKALRDGGFSSLEPIKMNIDSGGFPLPTKIGDLLFTAAKIESNDGPSPLDLTLADAAGHVLEHEHVDVMISGSQQVADERVSCYHRPGLLDAHRAGRRFYIRVRFWHNEECGAVPDQLVIWELPDPELAKLFAAQLEHWPADAQLFSTTGVLAKPDAIGRADQELAITLSHDGQSAWASATGAARASTVLVEAAAGWKIAAAAWTKPVANAAAERDAKAGKLATRAFPSGGDESLRAAFAKLATDGIATTNGDLVAIGSGPGERTVGPIFGKAWNAAWKGHIDVVAATAGLAPSKTTGWVAARIALHKKTYVMPFFVFAVFDKVGGEWSLVHIHFAV